MRKYWVRVCQEPHRFAKVEVLECFSRCQRCPCFRCEGVLHTCGCTATLTLLLLPLVVTHTTAAKRVPTNNPSRQQQKQVLFYTRMLSDILGRLLPRRKALAITAPAALLALAGALLVGSSAFFVYLQVCWVCLGVCVCVSISCVQLGMCNCASLATTAAAKGLEHMQPTTYVPSACAFRVPRAYRSHPACSMTPTCLCSSSCCGSLAATSSELVGLIWHSVSGAHTG